MSEPSTESPYGPADTGAASPVAPVSAAPPAWVEKGRRVLLLASAIAGGISVLLLIGLITLLVLDLGPANNDLAGLEEAISWFLIFGSPVLFVIALNLLIWRMLLRPLARMSTGGRVGLIIGVTITLGVVSVIAVVILLSLGFFLGLLAS